MAMTVDQKRLKATKFPPEFDTKVDTQKVNIDLMKKWIAGKITEILGDEDDVVIDTTYNLLEENRIPNIKAIQIQLTGFLGKDCAAFCKELWSLMLSAQNSPLGVPKELLEAKKLEMKQEQASKAAAESRRRDQAREETDMINSFRHNDRPERSERGRGGFGFGGRPPRGDRPGRGRDFDRRGGPPRRDSRSPPPCETKALPSPTPGPRYLCPAWPRSLPREVSRAPPLAACEPFEITANILPPSSSVGVQVTFPTTTTKALTHTTTALKAISQLVSIALTLRKAS
ncbi:PWI domain-containing protein [Lophiotrema nucula]|uniref:PWI domain-containing protein n=1 Tax=Lophiotrema nucula TaxID=690887 RepID=A0A6A5ZGG5_9PLEO|nr:PWI domain-containing protein [Lophiotrema nucula]